MKSAQRESAVSRQYTRFDRLFSQLDRALRTSTGATGRPAVPVAGAENRSPEEHRTLRQAHAALTIQTGLQAGAGIPGESPSSARQSALRADFTESALRDVTLAMQQTGVRPSLLSPALYASALVTGVVTAITGDTATRALRADSRRRVRRALTPPEGYSDDRAEDNAASDLAVDAALASARESIEKQNLSGVRVPHSAYEPKPSAAVGKLFDVVEKTVSKVVDKV